MKVMLIRKADQQTEAGVMPSEDLLQAMVDYNTRMVGEGVFLSGEGLRPSADGCRVEFHNGEAVVTDGPFAETKELIAGFSVLEVDSMEEAVAWARQWPVQDADGNARLELRRYYELADFAPGSAIQQHQQLCEQLARRPVNVGTHLLFRGDCSEAMAFYGDVLGGELQMMVRYRDTPAAKDVPADWQDKVIHARMSIGPYTVMGSDAHSDCYQPCGGSALMLEYEDLQVAETAFNRLADGGEVRMPFAETFWAVGFGMVTDRFGIGWMINCGSKELPAGQ